MPPKKILTDSDRLDKLIDLLKMIESQMLEVVIEIRRKVKIREDKKNFQFFNRYNIRGLYIKPEELDNEEK